MGSQQTPSDYRYVPPPKDEVRYPPHTDFPLPKEWIEHCKSLANDRDNHALRYISLQTTGTVKFFLHPSYVRGVSVGHFGAQRAQFEIIPQDDGWCRLRTKAGEYLAVSGMVGDLLVSNASPRPGSDLFRIEHHQNSNFINLYSWFTKCYVKAMAGVFWAAATAPDESCCFGCTACPISKSIAYANALIKNARMECGITTCELPQ